MRRLTPAYLVPAKVSPKPAKTKATKSAETAKPKPRAKAVPKKKPVIVSDVSDSDVVEPVKGGKKSADSDFEEDS